MACEHQNFTAIVNVNRINREDGGPVVAYSTDITVACRDCGQPFEWFGLPNGFSYYQPTISLDAKTIHIPLVIPGTRPPEGMAGYSVSHQVFDDKVALKQ